MISTPKQSEKQKPEHSAASSSSQWLCEPPVNAFTGETTDVALHAAAMSRAEGSDPVGLRCDADAAWAWLREQIFTRPQWVIATIE